MCVYFFVHAQADPQAQSGGIHVDRETFRQQIEQALAHIRDIVMLRTIPLGDLLTPGIPPDRRGWELSRRLLELIGELRPDDGGDEWVRRRYELLLLRYANGLSPDEVAERLCISRRHFYRQLTRALDEFADFCWAAIRQRAETPFPQTADAMSEGAILQREGAKQLQSERRARLSEVVGAVHSVLGALLERKNIAWQCALAPEVDSVALNPEILKQLLLALLGPILAQQELWRIEIASRFLGAEAELTLVALCAQGKPLPLEELENKPSVRLATMQGARVSAENLGEGLRFRLLLPVDNPRTVLIVDDNEEVCLLFRRYLSNAGYRVLTAQTGQAALTLARQHRPYAITLDLMMDHEDGWDVLQQLTHDPLTIGLPIIVCSVLEQEELALMLGATAFLKKPVMAAELLKALAALADRPSAAPVP
ncbi:MAG: response regulator [Chloroflexi bacterium]|nr:response regulator [Chloroflexota bacterium]